MVKPIDRITERRTIRRAAEEALEDTPTDPRMPVIVLAPEVDDDPSRDALPPGFAGNPRDGYAPHPATASTDLVFRLRPDPWYRTNAFKLVLVVLGLAAAVTALVVMLWPTSTDEPQVPANTTAPAPPPTTSPTPSPSATLGPPAPATIPPGAPLPPPPPPPPVDGPPPAAPPAYYPPRYYEPTEPSKPPQIDVTRAPISVAPSVKPAPGHDSSTPGDAPRRGFHW